MSMIGSSVAAWLPLLLSGSPMASAPVVLAPVATVQAGSYSKALEELSEQNLEWLLELAGWCQQEKAYRERDKVYGMVLELEPDHTKARKYLKYTKDRKSGKWIRKRPYREPKKSKPDLAELYRAKRAELDARIVDARLALIEAHKESLSPVRRDAELRETLKLAPDNEELRALLGYIKVTGKDGKPRWATQVVIDTEKRRDELMEVLEQAREDAPKSKAIETDRTDDKFDVDWEGLMGNERVRVVANTDDDEADHVARTVHAAWTFIPHVLGFEGRPPAGLTIYLVDGESDKSGFIESMPRISDEARERLYDITGTTVPGLPRFPNWSRSEVGRLDGSVKQMTVHMLNKQFGITTARGWIVEGAGLYINQMMVGTKLTRHIATSRYADDSGPKFDFDITDPDLDWLETATEVMESARPTRLAAAFGRNTNELRPEDLVLGYAFVAFLREGHGPEVLSKVLTKIGKEKGAAVTVVEEVLGAKLPAIHGSFKEWLNEVGSHPF